MTNRKYLIAITPFKFYWIKIFDIFKSQIIQLISAKIGLTFISKKNMYNKI